MLRNQNNNNMQTNGYNLLAYSKNINYTTLGFKQELITDQDIINNFRWLEQNSADNQRIVNSLDFYKITDTVNHTNVESIFNNMIRNTSAVVTEELVFNGQQYTLGDLIYKQTNGEAQRLFLSGGVYYPSLTDHNKIVWTYSNYQVSANSNPRLSYEWTLEEADNVGYGRILLPKDWEQTDTIVLGSIITKPQPNTESTVPIIPIIKGYWAHDDKEEEVYWNWNLTINSNQQWVLNNPENIPNIITKIVVK